MRFKKKKRRKKGRKKQRNVIGSIVNFLPPVYFFCSFRINDRVMSVNGVSLENVDYGTAVSVLRDSGAAVNLVVKRRIVLGAYPEPTTYKVTLTKSKKKDGM